MRYFRVASFTAWVAVVVACAAIAGAALWASARPETAAANPVGVQTPGQTQQQVFVLRTQLSQLPALMAQGVDVRPWASDLAQVAYAAANQRLASGVSPSDPVAAGYRSLADAASTLAAIDPAGNWPLVLGASRQVLSAGDALVALVTVDPDALAPGSLGGLLDPVSPVGPPPASPSPVPPSAPATPPALEPPAVE